MNYILLKIKHVKYGKNLKINGRIKIYNTGSIVIGDNVKINSSLNSNPVTGDGATILYAENGGTIRIGNNVGISNSVICSQNSIEVENDVFIGSGCKIYDTDFHSLVQENRKNKSNDVPKTSPVKIGNGAFIGACSMILKGVSVGEESIIGAGSVVSARKVPKSQIWGGNPAKYIKELGSD